MAIIVDPDNLDRADVIFGTAAQQISIYPVGDTERNGASVYYEDTWVETNGTIESVQNFATDSVVVGDVVAIQNNVDAGHYYVETIATVTLTLAAIDTGTGGAAITSLTADQRSYTEATDITGNVIAIAAHLYVTGDAIVLRGADVDTGLATNTVYYVIRVNAGDISLASTYANAVAGTALTLNDDGSGTTTLDDRLLVQVFNNGANTVENIVGLDTSGDGDGDVADGITKQALYSYGKEEWRIDTLIGAVGGSNDAYNDDLIRHQFPYEAITSEQFEVGGGTSHDNWNYFNLYTRKKVRTAGWAEKTDVGTGDLARETGIITLGSVDADSQVYYQQTSIVTPKADFTFLGPVNEALKIYDDASADNTPEDDFTTFLKLFVRKKGRSYTQSTISDIGVTTIGTIVNRFPLAHVVDTAITLSDSELLGSTPYYHPSAPTNIAVTGTQNDGATATDTEFDSAAAGFFADGVIPGDVLEITSGNDQGFYKILTVNSATELTIDIFEVVAAPNFTFNSAFTDTAGSLTYAIYTTILTPTPGETGVRDDGTKTAFPVTADTGIIDVDTATGTLTDTSATFVVDDIATGDIVLIEEAFELTFNASTEVDAVTADTITYSVNAGHNLATGDRIVYDDEGGTPITELTVGEVYYAAVESATRFFVCNTFDDAFDRANGISTEITLTPGSSETHHFEAHELDGAYVVISRDSSSVLTLNTADNPFPALVKPDTQYTIVEPGMYLQYKDKTIQKLDDQAGQDNTLTDLDFTTSPSTITIAGDTWDASIQPGDMLVISGTASNDGRYTVLLRDGGNVELTVLGATAFTAETNQEAGAVIYVRHGFERTLGVNDVSFNWRITGNGGSLQNNFEVIQEQLRSILDIDAGVGTFVPGVNTGTVGFIGNINDLLMTFASPTGTGLNLIIDNLDPNDINNATFNDHAGVARNFPFTSAGSLVFNPNLTNDNVAKYWLFFTDDNAPGDNLGRDYGSENAIIVDDATSPTPNPIFGFINAAGGDTHQGGGTGRSVDSGTTSITFTYAYDTNVQRGSGSSSNTAPVTLVAIGAPTAQFVIATGSITNTTGITISAVAALERNYNGSL